MKNNVKYLIVILLLIILGVVGFTFYRKYRLNSIELSNKSDVDKEQNNTEFNGDKEQNNDFMYKIYYSEYDGSMNFYGAFIDGNYNLYTSKFGEYNKGYLVRDENGNWSLNDNDFILEIKGKLEKDSKIVNLNKDENEYLKQFLNKVEYEKNNNIPFQFGNLYIINSKNESFVSNSLYSVELASIVNMMLNNDTSYLNNSLISDITKYIKDDSFNELNHNSTFIENLYSKVSESSQVMDYYVENKITNDTIITLTLKQMMKNLEFIENTKENECSSQDEDECPDYSYFNMDKFDKYAKELFGENVAYNISKYNGYGNGCYYFLEDSQQLYMSNGTGCGFSEGMINELVYSYQVDNKIVIIEKSLYMTYGECDSNIPCFTEKYGLTEGIYNNITDKKLLTPDFSTDAFLGVSNIELLNKYSDFATYYSYTFTQDNNGNYYYTDFKKLN